MMINRMILACQALSQLSSNRDAGREKVRRIRRSEQFFRIAKEQENVPIKVALVYDEPNLLDSATFDELPQAKLVFRAIPSHGQPLEYIEYLNPRQEAAAGAALRAEELQSRYPSLTFHR
jgi:hypothetical protein